MSCDGFHFFNNLFDPGSMCRAMMLTVFTLLELLHVNCFQRYLSHYSAHGCSHLTNQEEEEPL